MRIHVVTLDTGWILPKIAERIVAANADPDVSMTLSAYTADPSADANFYVDLQNTYRGQKTKCDVAFLTHAHENKFEYFKWLFDQIGAYSLNGIVGMNRRYTEMLPLIGYPAERTTTIVPGETKDIFKLKKLRIGIVSRGQDPGYGPEMMRELFTRYDFTNFVFRFLGSGWEHLSDIAREMSIEIELITDESYSNYPPFYQSIDYLLIPTLWTAGPMCMQEALACGIPIIASDVGFVNYEFEADYVYPPGDHLALCKILRDIEFPLLRRRGQIGDMTWERYTAEVVKFIKKIQ